MGEKTILLADDDPGHVVLFRKAITQSGIPCRVDCVHDGTEVIEYLFGAGRYKDRRTADMPSLILLDLKMPAMDGLQVLQILRRVRGEDRTRFPPIVVLTSSEDENDIAQAYGLGAQSYIRKPPEFSQFAEAVRDTVHYWLGLNQVAPRRAPKPVVHEGLCGQQAQR